jgi:hypothetical protein
MPLQSCTKLYIGSFLAFLCLKWKPYPTVIFHRSRTIWVLICIGEFSCLWSILTSVQAASAFLWASLPVACVLWMYVCVPCRVQPELLGISLLRKVYVVYDWQSDFSSFGECDMDRLGFVSFLSSNSLTIFVFRLGWFAVSVKQCLSKVNTAASAANFAVVDSVEVGRSAVHIRYNSGPRTLTWGTPALTEENSVFCSNFTRKCLLYRWDLSKMK